MNTTPLSPPDPSEGRASAPGTAPGVPASAPTLSGESKVSRGLGITISAAIVGGFALLGAGGGAAFAATGQFSSDTVIQGAALDVAGLKALDVDSAAARVNVRFANVDEATLDVSGQTRGDWQMRREGDKLTVRGPQETFGWWIGAWAFDEVTVTVTLPSSLDGLLDADLAVSSGSLRADGGFRELEVELGAGSVRVDGSARTVKAEVSAGRADLSLANVSSAELSASAGRLQAAFSGRQPERMVLDLTAGSMDVAVPKGVYAVQDEVSAGRLDNQLETSAAATSTVRATVSAGTLTLRPAD
ncbi:MULTISPECIES: DUF4097 family beta strand repeat-containing protein [Bacteria]|uniref:DUF4097 family beta strand repeat-containing protein n=1 Tax=Bacteria TaxID=2 RepID=UPI003C7A4D4F